MTLLSGSALLFIHIYVLSRVKKMERNRKQNVTGAKSLHAHKRTHTMIVHNKFDSKTDSALEANYARDIQNILLPIVLVVH